MFVVWKGNIHYYKQSYFSSCFIWGIQQSVIQHTSNTTFYTVVSHGPLYSYYQTYSSFLFDYGLVCAPGEGWEVMLPNKIPLSWPWHSGHGLYQTIPSSFLCAFTWQGELAATTSDKGLLLYYWTSPFGEKLDLILLLETTVILVLSLEANGFTSTINTCLNWGNFKLWLSLHSVSISIKHTVHLQKFKFNSKRNFKQDGGYGAILTDRGAWVDNLCGNWFEVIHLKGSQFFKYHCKIM